MSMDFVGRLVTVFGEPNVLYRLEALSETTAVVKALDHSMPEEIDPSFLVPFTVPAATW